MISIQETKARMAWASTLPEKWRLCRLKSVANIRYGLGQPPAELSTGVAMVRATDVDAGTIRTDKLLLVDPAKLPLDRNPYLKAGEIIVVRSGAYTGDSAIVPPALEGAIAGYDMVTTVTHASAQFVAYGLLSKYVLEDQILLLTLRAAQPHLNAEELGSVIFAMPSTRYEQERIAAYLNASCAAIDAAVSAKRRQLKTLDALKRSAIFHAVTRGLDDSDSLKASGIDWLGEIPAHWTIRRIKDIAELRSGDAIQSEDIAPEGDYPVYGGNGLRGFTSSYTHNGQFALIGRQGALCGNINYADGMFWATEHAVVATLLRRYDTLWFGELLRAMNLGQYSNAAAQPGLAVDRIKFLRLPVPPPEEQTRIAEHVRTIIQQNESIGTAIQSQITTLNAYRNSLIHECVTGQRRITEADLVRVGRGKSTLTRSSR